MPEAKPTPTVLIADNDVAVNALLTDILCDRGLHCESVHDGEQALARLRRGGIDVLVTDLDMPNLDGQGLFEHLPEIDPPPDTVVISGYLDRAVEETLDALPLVRHIFRKPFDVHEFAAVVFGIANRRAGSDGAFGEAEAGGSSAATRS